MRDAPIPLSPRLAAKVDRDFDATERPRVIASLERIDLGSWRATRPPLGRERVLAAVLVLTRGDVDRLTGSIGIAERDWRDALVWAGLGNPDWPARLDALFGPA